MEQKNESGAKFVARELQERFDRDVVAHEKDSDCDVDESTGCCRVCGVDHSGDPCVACRGRGFHVKGCERDPEANIYNDEPVEFTESPAGERARESWARSYDDLNGAPESDFDR